ncbi:MAG: hypothetical protein ACYCQJ_01150 [Nitrososphaerales archaeon]
MQVYMINNTEYSQGLQKDSPFYWPRKIGSSVPQGKDVYEIIVLSSSPVESLPFILEVTDQHKIKIIKLRLEVEKERSAILAYLDFSLADCTPHDYSKQIKELKLVKDARFVSRADSIFGYHTFPVIVNGKDRAWIMRAKALLSIEEKLIEMLGTAAESIMFQEGRAYGYGVAQAQQEIENTTDEKMRVHNFKEGSRASGFGILDYDYSEDHLSLNVTVLDPLTDSKGECNSYFIFGTLAGGIEVINGVTLRVASHYYNKDDKTLHVKYSLEK